jgi:hypothetical protein
VVGAGVPVAVVVGVVVTLVVVVVEVVSDGESSLDPHAANTGVTASAALNPTTADHRRSPRQPDSSRDEGFACCIVMIVTAPRGVPGWLGVPSRI